jgi:hypothetical protein
LFNDNDEVDRGIERGTGGGCKDSCSHYGYEQLLIPSVWIVNKQLAFDEVEHEDVQVVLLSL